MPKFDTDQIVMGERMRQRREALGLSQREVADRLGLSQVAYSQYERGRNSLSATDLPRLTNALSCSIGYLFGEDDDEQKRLEKTIVAQAVTGIQRSYPMRLQHLIMAHLLVSFLDDQKEKYSSLSLEYDAPRDDWPEHLLERLEEGKFDFLHISDPHLSSNDIQKQVHDEKTAHDQKQQPVENNGKSSEETVSLIYPR